MSDTEVPKLVTTRPDAEIAADLKKRAEEAAVLLCALLDEAVTHGLQIQFDGFIPGPPFFKHSIRGLRVVKQF